ncbi:MAG: Mut7-C RNAse domain-containing protein [Thermoplasmata archaeon]|nr:Mut7-C RNAse domain-containing protein [Thermoplasmata archaeon]
MAVEGAAPGPLPRFLADEMLGRLARYLRFAGFDTAYARGLADEEILRWAERESRTLLTRDRRLAARRPDAVLLSSGALDGQVRGVRASFPALRFGVRFDRCTMCNGELRVLPVERYGDAPALPAAVRESGEPVFRCSVCGHLYWEGSHTRAIRDRFEQWGR